MVLEKVNINGIENAYFVSSIIKEFEKAVNEAWKDKPPWQRFQKKLISDLAVLSEYKENALYLPQYEKLSGKTDLYSIRHPETKKNVRVIYTMMDGRIVLLTAFLEKNEGDYTRAICTAEKRLKWLKAKIS